MSTATLATTTVASFAPYSGPWTFQQAAHLLRRTTFSPHKWEIDQAVTEGLTSTLARLFDPTAPAPAPPVYYDYDGNAGGGIGTPWVNLPLQHDDRSNDNNARTRSLQAYWYLSTAETSVHIRERMLVFWHNHFGMSNINESRTQYELMQLFRNEATGNVRQLVKTVTINPNMLRFLNGNVSTAANPNENFAREILELFTIGKGPQVGPGDYTTYTEQDVTELARAFTGWRTRYFNSTNAGETHESYFQANRHDDTTKTLSHRFNNVVIQPNGDQEYQDVVDIIFQQDEVARYLCRKLYRYFVYYTIDADIEQNIIQPMANLLIANNYDLAPALGALLGSTHFYELQVAGDVIKSPFEFMQSIFRPSLAYDQPTVTDKYLVARRAHSRANALGQDIRNPPSVAGWPVYYQEPSYNRLWLNTATLQARTLVQRDSTIRTMYITGNGYPRLQIDWLGLLDDFANPYDPNDMINEMTLRLLPQPLDSAQEVALKDLLLPGLQDFVWTNEYADLQANPNDPMLRDSVAGRLNNMMYGLMQLAEFQVH